ncbi:MAG: LemA family protein [Gemmatimonadota bacterium]
MVYFIASAFALLVLWAAWVFNGLIGLRNRLRAAWGDVDAMLKRRADLVPNLVAAVRGYAGHEQTTLERVTAARADARTAGATPEAAAARAAAEGELSLGLGQLLVLAEAYPALRANTNFLALQAELIRTEDDIASARRYYNAVVRDFNTRRETFPNLLLAAPFGFHPGEPFELAEAGERRAPDVGAEDAR